MLSGTIGTLKRLTCLRFFAAVPSSATDEERAEMALVILLQGSLERQVRGNLIPRSQFFCLESVMSLHGGYLAVL